jgi:hypothetical protein
MAMGTAACSSSDSAGGGPADAGDAGGDSSVAPAGDAGKTPNADASGVVSGDAGTKATACTAGPFVAYRATITKVNSLAVNAPLVGAQIGFSTCEGFELTTDAKGQASTQLTQAIPVTPLYAATGTISSVGAEIPASADVAESLTLFDDTLTPFIPGFALDGGGNAAIVEIVLAVDAAATAPCNATSGVTLTVTGHSEATVSYMGATWPTDPNVASTTASTDGTRAFIGGVVGATKVQIAGTKTGCNVVLVTGSQTGNFSLLAGSITIGTATITN